MKSMSLPALMLGFSCMFGIVPGHATDFTGVWASSSEACAKMFVRNGKNISFARNADMFGSGFIVEGNRIRGKMATCTITRRKEDGDMLHVLASCSSDIALQTMQITVKIDGPDRIIRQFAGMPEMQMHYSRCSF